MATRVYLLLELVNGNKAEITDLLKEMPGIVATDILEGPPDLLALLESPTRQKAAEDIMGILDMVEGSVVDIRVLPVAESTNLNIHDKQEASRKKRKDLKAKMVSHV